MDLRLSDDDRVGGAFERRSAKSKPAARPAPKTGLWGRPKSGRVEPTVGMALGDFVDDDYSGSPPSAPKKPEKRGRKPAVKTAAKTTSRRGAAVPARLGRDKKARKRWSMGGFLFKIFYWCCIFGLWGAIALAGIIGYFYVQLPASNTWAVPERPANIQILAADGQLMSNRGQSGGEAVALRELPYYIPAALVAIEDRRFYEHFGVDLLGLFSVGLETIRGEDTRGASTITQQLAKNLFLTPEQTLGRKVQEALLAIWLEQNYSKEQILELYLNRMFFGTDGQGRSLIGIEAAAQAYFGKSARNLSLGEGAILVGSLQAPSRLNPRSGDTAVVQARQTLVLQAMAREKYITEAEAKAAEIDPTQQIRTRVPGAEYYVADWVESLMQAYLGEIKEDVVVYTTIDWALQKQAEFVVKEAVAKQGGDRGFTQGALVAMDVDGTVRAMVGGTDYAVSQYNRAITAKRQPGSAFKPFVYVAAMEKGYTPDTLAEDAPFDFNGWSPENASHKYNGTVSLRTGLAYSLNTIAARLAIDVTPEKVIEVAMRLGISSPLVPLPAIALGTEEVNLLELTSAYAPFANGGLGVIPNVITRIETMDGKVLYDAVPGGPGQVLDPLIVAEMNDMLRTAVEVGTGKGANVGGWEFAGKTGTSQKAKDALFVGYTAHMVTGVWLGNDDNSSTTLSGGNVPVQIWSEFMAKAHEGLAATGLPGYPAAPAATVAGYDANGNPYAVDANGNAYLIDATGQPLQAAVPTADGQSQATGQATGEATGQQQQPQPQERRTLVDLIDGLF